MLTGKHRPGTPTEGTRFTLGRAQDTYTERYWNHRMFASVEEIRAVAEDAGVPMATLAVQWTLANPVVTSPIIGASRPEQLAASVAAVDTPLDPDVKTRLDEITAEYRQGDHDR
jgi:aryl-alcohol dehydrogenase (NADP+)